MTRILYLQPVGHPLFDEYFESVLRPMAASQEIIDVEHLSLTETPTSPFLPPPSAFHSELLRHIDDAARMRGYDAIIIGCSSDPGLREARRSVPVPVLAPFSAALTLAALRAERLGIVTPGPQEEVIWLWDNVRMLGLGELVADIRIAELNHPAEDEVLARRMVEDPNGVRDEILQLHRESVRREGSAYLEAERLVEEGAGAIVLACTFWGGMQQTLEEELGVFVVDPCRAPLRMAEALMEGRGE